MFYRLMAFLRERLRPSLGDLVLAAMGAQLFCFREGWPALLADGDRGWHLRTGKWILQNRPVPTTDLFTSTRAGEPWFAWEWLSDLPRSPVHLHWGLAGVAVLADCVILCSVMVLFRHMLWRGANIVVALGVLLLAGRSLPSLSLRAFLLTPVPYLGTFSGVPWNVMLPVGLVAFSTIAVFDSLRQHAIDRVAVRNVAGLLPRRRPAALPRALRRSRAPLRRQAFGEAAGSTGAEPLGEAWCQA